MNHSDACIVSGKGSNGKNICFMDESTINITELMYWSKLSTDLTGISSEI